MTSAPPIAVQLYTLREQAKDAYHDGSSETFTEYDSVWRPTKTSSAGGVVVRQLGYDAYGRPSTVSLNGSVLSTSSYDGNGELNAVAYNANGTSLAQIVRDSAGRTSKVVWKKGAVLLGQDEITVRSQSGRVVSSVASNGSTSVVSSFGYDAAGRLTNATVGSQTWVFGFGTAGCGVVGAGIRRDLCRPFDRRWPPVVGAGQRVQHPARVGLPGAGRRPDRSDLSCVGGSFAHPAERGGCRVGAPQPRCSVAELQPGGR